VSSPRVRLLLVVVLFTACLLLPGASGSWFAGAPLDGRGYMLLCGAITLAVAAMLLPSGQPIRWSWPAALLVVTVAKVLVVSGAPVVGWRGEYFREGQLSQHVLFLSGIRAQPNRVDRRIYFPSGSTFGLHFLNDQKLYGATFSNRERSLELPLRVEWRGYFALERDTTVRFELSGRSKARVVLDGREVYDFDLDAVRGPSVESRLSAGLHLITVAYDKPSMQEPVFGFEALAGGRPLVPAPNRQSAIRLAGLSGWVWGTNLLGALALLLLALSHLQYHSPVHSLFQRLRLGRGEMVLISGFAILLTAAVVSRVVPLGSSAVHLWAGDDALVYEGCARNILLEGLLMPNGAPLGQGAPFYHYPLYSYALAAAHALLGEQFSAVVFLNVLSISCLLPLSWWLGWRRLPAWAVGAGTATLGLFAARHMLGYSVTAFSDSFFYALVFAALVASVRAMEDNAPGWWVLAGVTASAAAATRPSFMTFAGVFPLAVFAFRRKPVSGRARAAGMFVAGFLAGVAPFAIRNWIVARKFVLLVNSWIQIPYFLYRWDEPNPVTPVASLADALARAFEIFRADPLRVVDIELRKLAFTLGFTQAGPSYAGTHWEFPALLLLFVVALAMRKVPKVTAVVLGAFALSHVAALLLAAPWTYGYKTILPLHAAFLFASVYLIVPHGLLVPPRASVGSR